MSAVSNIIPVLKRSLRLLEHLRDHPEGKSLSELDAELDIPKTTLFRIVKTFEAAGYVEMDPASGKYVLSWGCLRIGLAVLDRTNLERAARPVMVEIADRHGIACKLSLPRPEGVLCVAKEDVRDGIGITSGTGTVFPYHAGAAGKLLLALKSREEAHALVASAPLKPFTAQTITDPDELLRELEEIRRRGYAIDRGEYKAGIRAVAFPVRNHSGDVVAALSGVFLTEQAALEDVAALIREGARRISTRLGAANRSDAADASRETVPERAGVR